MDKNKQYILTKWYWLLPVFVTGLIVYQLLQTENLPGMKIFWVIMGLVSWVGTLTMPIKITIQQDAWLVVQSVVRTQRVNLQDITAFQKGSRSITVLYRGGKVDIPYYSQGIDLLFDEMRRLNPSIHDELSPIFKFSQSMFKVILWITALLIVALLLVLLAMNIPAFRQFLN